MKHKPIAITVLTVLFFCGALQGLFSQERQKGTDGYYRVEKESIRFEWKIEGRDLHVKVEAPTTGWIAVGFDPETRMKGANIIIGYVKNGTAEVEDHFGTGATSHRADADIGGSFDVSDISGYEGDGKTTLEYSIPLDSGDERDKPLRQGNQYKIILAYGRNNADNFRSIHWKRTSLSIEL